MWRRLNMRRTHILVEAPNLDLPPGPPLAGPQPQAKTTPAQDGDVTRVTTEPAHRLLRNFCSDAVENSIRLVSLARRTHEQGRLPSKYYDCAAGYERGGSTTKQTHQAVALPQNG